MRHFLKLFQEKWKSYRHRFVPWIVLNLRRNERTLRHVQDRIRDKPIADGEVLRTLVCLFTALLQSDWRTKTDQLHLLPANSREKYLSTQNGLKRTKVDPCATMLQTLGFCIERKVSSLPSAGMGVFVTEGQVPKGVTVAMYPGAVYQAGEPILIQSIRNQFVFRCIDGILIDGNDKGLSKLVFLSCSGRDRFGPFRLSDSSWLTPHPENPLAVGQYVNNCSNDLLKPQSEVSFQEMHIVAPLDAAEMAANVCYQEFDVPDEFPLELRQYLPNINYKPETQRPLRCVVLVSLRDISKGEELFSNYYTIVQ